MIRRITGVGLTLVLMFAGSAAAQSADRAEIDRKIDALLAKRWDENLARASAELRLSKVGARVTGSDSEQAAAYSRSLDLFGDDAEFKKLVDQAYVRSMIDEKAESRMATAVNSTSTNPATAGLAERSGSTALAAIAGDFANIVSSDKTAVSINLNALAFVSLVDSEVYSELHNYQEYDLARRFSGTVTFGAKIPEKEITGLSALPTFDTLLDTFSWDVKIRVLGDKDIRSGKWTNDNVRIGGILTQKAAVLLTLVAAPGTDPVAAINAGRIFQQVMSKRIGASVAAIKARVAKSAQLSVKAAGTHLTKEVGKNKYTFAALFDMGAGPSDITANAQYSSVDGIQSGTQTFTTRSWTLSAAVTSHLAPDALVVGRTIDWVVGANALVFVDKAAIPVAAENAWKFYSSFDFPVKGGGKIPVSVIYTNDPNALVKQNYVSGQVGFSYDFSALKELFLGAK